VNEPLALAPFAAGLTNQKLALVGLAIRAREEKRPVLLGDLVDYELTATTQAVVPFGSVLDHDGVVSAFQTFGVAVAAGSTEMRDGPSLLGVGGEALADSRRAGDMALFDHLCRLLGAMRPAPPIAAAAVGIGAWLAARGVRWGCQFRIERDWLHWTALHRADARVDPAEALYVDYPTILAKLTDRIGADAGPVYVTCNEADLPVERTTIIRHAREVHGIDLLFRSALPNDFVPAGPLAGAALDFAIASTLPHFAGHTRSTFFGALALAAHGEERAADFWLYNNRGPMLKRRIDHGAFVRPWAAANL
jgi:hypothetical protein